MKKLLVLVSFVVLFLYGGDSEVKKAEASKHYGEVFSPDKDEHPGIDD
ncbi:hypothetical protein [Sutcliffiella rhizosphaerae]|uniref:Uncharacterized protein n=1 Tax=Sutcliffiella rhizosphaerae TaxID=2880967 RepID=A0ABM8YPU0_9BACI|nr:hypothetical protein [Sutcliffiella rhizosphaerae]CAG9621788.1 hypothetical protein BACCIP111883_02561 [Sutcliffiella rhizosphaerae]